MAHDGGVLDWCPVDDGWWRDILGNGLSSC